MSTTNQHCITWHTMSLCIGKRDLLKDDPVKQLVQEVIKKSQEKYSYTLINSAIRDNNFQLIIQTDAEGPSISRIMQFIKSRIAEGCNTRMNRTGPFWNGRSRKTILEDPKNSEAAFV